MDGWTHDLKQGSEWGSKRALCCAVCNPNGPKSMLQHHVQTVECTKIYRCEDGMLMKDGRFAFLLKGNKRICAILSTVGMKLRTGEDCGLFPKDDGEYIMYRVEQGMDWLHGHSQGPQGILCVV